MTAHAGMLRLAVVTVGAVAVGIAMDDVLQAIPVPREFAPLPRRAGALAGVAEFDGALLPVVDLARWVETGTARAEGAARRIVVLRHGARRIGMLADGIAGFADVPSQGMTRLHHADDADEVFESAVKVPETGAILSVLEVARLVALACAWHESDGAEAQAPAPDGAGNAGGAQAAPGRLHALLRAGTATLAVPATALAAVEPKPVLGRVGMGAAFCEWRGRQLPVLDWQPAGGGSPVPERALLAVLEHGGDVLGLLVDAALDMRELPPRESGAGGVLHAGDGLVIDMPDVAGLFARHPETALSRVPAAAPRQGGHAVNDVAQVLCDAAGTMAVPIDSLEQVLPFAAADDDGAAAPTMAWRGRTLAVRDLRGKPGPGHVLVVRTGERCAAFVVERIRSLIPAGGGRVFTLGQGARYIHPGDGEGQASYRMIELSASLNG